MGESKISLNTQNSSLFFFIPFFFPSPEGNLEASCDNLQRTSVPLIQPTVYIEDRDPIPEEQVKKKVGSFRIKIGLYSFFSCLCSDLLVLSKQAK